MKKILQLLHLTDYVLSVGIYLVFMNFETPQPSVPTGTKTHE